MTYDLAHCADLISEQDRGAPCVIVHPVTGEPMDVSFTVAGPDSDTARRATLRMQDDLLAYRSDRPSADEQFKLHCEYLARLVLGWDAKHDGKSVAFSFSECAKLFAGNKFIREQVEAFAASRVAYFAKTPFVEAA